MIVAEWKKGTRIPANAEKVYDEIQEFGNSITPENILKKAKDEKTELHKCFTWDDTKAAEKYRLWEARHIINNLVIKVQKDDEKEPQQVRIFQHVENEYSPIEYIVQKPELLDSLLIQAEKEMKAFSNRYAQLTQLDGVLTAINQYFE